MEKEVTWLILLKKKLQYPRYFYGKKIRSHKCENLRKNKH